MESSPMRSRALPIFCTYPCWVWTKETALLTLYFAAWMRLIWASIREATASPAASSEGWMILVPELRRARDLLNRVCVVCRLSELIWA